MSSPPYRCAVLSAVKHDYVARGMASHPLFELAVVADDPAVPPWAHERNEQLAGSFGIPSRCRVRVFGAGPDRPVAVVLTGKRGRLGSSLPRRAYRNVWSRRGRPQSH